MFNDNNNNDLQDMAMIISPVSPPEDPDYLYRRAEQELELAQAATHPAVVKAHYLLADHYLETLHGQEAEAA